MNAERLLKLFDRVADMPEAIPRLRAFALDLAVRGKLVARDPRNEPAETLVSDHLDRSERSTGEPFAVPQGWLWTTIGGICSKTGSGSTPRGGKAVYQSTGVPFLRSQNVHDGGISLSDVAYIDNAVHARMAGTTVRPGDLLLNITGGSIGRCALVPPEYPEANVSQHVAILRTAVEGVGPYLHLVIRSPYFQSLVTREQTGAGRGGLPKNRMDALPVALPPLAEQRRIVAKVDELMALCDQLEAALRKRDTVRDLLASSSAASVTARNAHSDNTRFALAHVDRWIAKQRHTRELRRAIFDLGVCGRLSPTAIRDAVLDGESPGVHDAFALPTHWKWVRLGDVVAGSDSGWSPRTESYARTGEAWGVLKVSAVSWDRFRPEENKQLLAGAIPRAEMAVSCGDFLISRANTRELIAKAVIVADDVRQLIMSDKIVRLKFAATCRPQFAWLVINHASYARAYFAENASGVSASMKNLSRQAILGLPLPLPPLEEQTTIMRQVDELIRLCDRLEASLAAGDRLRSRLLDSLLAEALALTDPVSA